MPKTTAEVAQELARQSMDCSFLLTHLVRQNDSRSTEDARRVLELILNVDVKEETPLLRGTSVGWYGAASGANVFNPTSNDFDRVGDTRAVCFTDSTLAGLRAHRDVFNARYGVAFDRELLFNSKGANPCLNIRGDLLRAPISIRGSHHDKYVYNYIPSNLTPFVNTISEGFDATHEREWRVAGDMPFAYSDLMFIFCPQADFPRFSGVQTCGRPTLFDLEWLDRV